MPSVLSNVCTVLPKASQISGSVTGCLVPTPPPPHHPPLHLSRSLSPSSNIPHLCNSPFASLSSPLPIPSLSLWGVAVMKMKSRSLCHCLLLHSAVHHLSICLQSSPDSPPWPHPLPSILYQAEKHSQELFKQNANGLQMDPSFPQHCLEAGKV